MRTALLVSVCNADEADEALAGGADVIDVKEPIRGAMGAATAEVWREVTARVAARAPVSLALGELGDPPPPAPLPGIAFVKLGLAGAAAMRDWPRRWRAALERWPRETQRVAVLYADGVHAGMPAPGDILREARHAGCQVLLIDTWDKTGDRLTAWLARRTLDPILREARQMGLRLALAGSLRPRDVDPVITSWRPDWSAVRSAACRGGRAGRVTRTRVARLVALAHAPRSDPPLLPVA